MERRILLISILVTIGAIAFLSGYLLMPEKGLNRQIGLVTDRFSNQINTGPSNNKVPGTAPLSSRKFLTFVSSGFEKIVAVDKNGDIIEIDTVNFREKVLITLKQSNILEALLSPAGNSIIYSFYDTKNDKKHIYLNLSAKSGKNESANIAGNMKSADFSPHGDQAAYLISSEDGGELLIAKGANIIKRALKTRLGAALVAWPSDFISIISYNKDGYGDLFVLKDNGTLNKIISYQYGLNVKWSLSGEKIIFSVKDDTNFEHLFYQNIKNKGSIIDLNTKADASKCLWISEEEIICGIRNKVELKDEFYKISVDDGSKKLILTPNINILIKEMALNRPGNTLFVLNDIDSKLYALKLAELD